MEDIYDTNNIVLYWKSSDIRYWCQSKENVPVIIDGLSFADRKIKCLQSLYFWGAYLKLQGKHIELNRFSSDTLYDAIDYYRLD